MVQSKLTVQSISLVLMEEIHLAMMMVDSVETAVLVGAVVLVEEQMLMETPVKAEMVEMDSLVVEVEE